MPYQVVCHYVPDIAKDERIIFAVIIIDGDLYEISFTDDWERIDNFVGHRVNTLRSFAQEEWTSEKVKEFLESTDWKIHFSERKGTIRPFHEAIIDAIERYLKT